MDGYGLAGHNRWNSGSFSGVNDIVVVNAVVAVNPIVGLNTIVGVNTIGGLNTIEGVDDIAEGGYLIYIKFVTIAGSA